VKKAFIVTSCIEVDNNYPLTYSQIRSHFDSAERFKHTVFTIASLDGIRDPDITIFVIDASDNWQNYAHALSYQSNLEFVSIKQQFPEIYSIVKSHRNKSHCESLMLMSFIEKYKKELSEYDYLFKLSGRYFVDSHFTLENFTVENQDKIFFKKPLMFDWDHHWNYTMVDRRSIQGNNKLYQYCSVLYGWGKHNTHIMQDVFRLIVDITGQPNGMIYDAETLLYFLTRTVEHKIIETDWMVYGWEGPSGNFLRY
jgi:hypothetical protein